MADGYGFLRTENFEQGDNDIYIAQSQIKRFGLRTGDNVMGVTRAAREGERYDAILYVKSVNGDNPDKLSEDMFLKILHRYIPVKS